MRFLLALLFAIGCSASPAAAQVTSLTLHADPVPIVDAQINGHPLRLEIDLRLPPVVLLNQSVVVPMGVRTSVRGDIVVMADGATQLRGRRAARAALTIGGVAVVPPMSGMFASPVTDRADGLIGPFILPQRVITVTLGPEAPGERDIILPLSIPQRWGTVTQIGGQALGVEFNIARQETVISRSASRAFDLAGLITNNGPVERATIIFGLTTRVQPVRTELAALGLALAPAVARTAAPLTGPDGAEVIVIDPRTPPPPSISLGRGALSRCSSISVDRVTQRMTLRCAT